MVWNYARSKNVFSCPINMINPDTHKRWVDADGKTILVRSYAMAKNFAFCDGHAAYYRYPAGPFSYDYPNFTGWSTAAYPINPGGKGYCGWADNVGAAGELGKDGKCLAGANLPR